MKKLFLLLAVCTGLTFTPVAKAEPEDPVNVFVKWVMPAYTYFENEITDVDDVIDDLTVWGEFFFNFHWTHAQLMGSVIIENPLGEHAISYVYEWQGGTINPYLSGPGNNPWIDWTTLPGPDAVGGGIADASYWPPVNNKCHYNFNIGYGGGMPMVEVSKMYDFIRVNVSIHGAGDSLPVTKTYRMTPQIFGGGIL